MTPMLDPLIELKKLQPKMPYLSHLALEMEINRLTARLEKEQDEMLADMGRELESHFTKPAL